MNVFILLFSIIAMGLSLPSTAEITNYSQAINESGRLRMLSQRMAKASLLNKLDIQPRKAQEQLQASINLFESNLAELSDFSLKTNSADSLKISLDSIEQQWAKYKEELTKSKQEFNPNNILLFSDQTLASCEELVQKLEAAAERHSAHWVNISGRQRMLSQRIAKLYSMISLLGDSQQHGQALQLAIKEFDEALAVLLNSPENTHFVTHKLKKVATQWNFSKQGFKALTKGDTAPLVISMTTESIFDQMNDITDLYEEIDRKNHLKSNS